MATKKPRSAAQEAAMQAAKDARDEAAATAAYDRSITSEGMKCGGKVKGYAKGGMTRGDGIAQRGKTKGRMV